MDGASEEEAPQLATGLSTPAWIGPWTAIGQAGVDEGDGAEQGMEGTEADGRQLLSTETLLCYGENDGLEVALRKPLKWVSSSHFHKSCRASGLGEAQWDQ